MIEQERYQPAKRITLISALVNIALGIIKVIGGILWQSHALLADGIHSWADVGTDCMVLFAAKYGSQHADASHPYGHRRIETAATLLLALLLILAGLGIAWDSLIYIISEKELRPNWEALAIAILSILANEILFYYTHYVGKEIRSQLVLANAWHHRSDAAASVIVAIGVLGSIWGWRYLDAMAAILVSGMIIKMGLSYGFNSVKELVDTAVEPQLLAKIQEIIHAVPGVEKIHQLRSRYMGGDVLVDVHILVGPYISVSEGHYIAQHVHHTLIKQLSQVKDVIVHVDPEDDENVCPSLHLPNREQMQAMLLQSWQQAFPTLIDWVIHYLDGKMLLDLIFTAKPEQWVYQRINKDLHAFKDLNVRLFVTYGSLEQEPNSN